MNLKEKQAAAKQTFVFLGSLANEYPAKQDVECDSTDSWACDIMSVSEGEHACMLIPNGEWRSWTKFMI